MCENDGLERLPDRRSNLEKAPGVSQ
jgi:hypothetical protein